MIRLLGAAALALASTLSSPALAEDARKPVVTVLTAHPAAHALAASLTAGTDVRVTAVQPAKLPASRLASFLGGRGAGALNEAATGADAVVTFRSFWPDDPLYPHARRANIRIVELDAGRPIDGALPGIAVVEPADDRATYAALDLTPMPASGEGASPWLAPTSLGRMADVLAADLRRLAPAAEGRIADNLAGIKARLLAARAKVEGRLAAAPSVAVLALSGRYGYLATDLGLELVGGVTAAPSEWTPERARALETLLRTQGVAAVLLDAEPNAETAAAIRAAGAKPVALASIEGGDLDPVAAVEANLDRIAAALAGPR